MDQYFFKIVIPVYNNTDHLPECLASLSDQTLEDWHCVLVDDQSTDGSYEFVKNYAIRHPEHFSVTRTTERHGQGGCRNVGIAFPIEGEYYFFMDADDYLYNNDTLKTMYDCVVEDKPGLALFDWCFDKGGRIYPVVCKDFCDYLCFLQLADTPWSMPWTKLIRADYMERFLEDCFYGEDLWQFLKVLDRSPLVAQYHKFIYMYRKYPGNFSKTLTHRRHIPLFNDLLKNLMNTCRTAEVAESIRNRLAGIRPV